VKSKVAKKKQDDEKELKDNHLSPAKLVIALKNLNQGGGGLFWEPKKNATERGCKKQTGMGFMCGDGGDSPGESHRQKKKGLEQNDFVNHS